VNVSETERWSEGEAERASARADQGKGVRGRGADRQAASSQVDHCK
jgi:hypothetical protein